MDDQDKSKEELIHDLNNLRAVLRLREESEAWYEKLSEELALSEDRFRKLFESAPDAFLLYESSGVFVDGNRAAELLLGCRRAELIGKNLFELGILTPQAPEGSASSGADSPRRPTPPSEQELVRHDGVRVPVEIRSFPIQVDDRTLILGIARDLTERRRNDKERRELEEQLRHSQKMEAIGRLAGVVAHDFNNLMSIITNYAGIMLQELAPDNPGREFLNEIQDAVRRAAMLTRQLLAYSRREPVTPEVIDLGSAIREQETTLARLTGETIDLEIRMVPQKVSVRIARTHLEQILLNLLINARDAMVQGGRLLIQTTLEKIGEKPVAGRPGVLPGQYIVLKVSDTGCGILPEIKDRIFEPFFTTKSREKGTGIGLPSVYGIVKQAEGHIFFHSEPGEGTTFEILFPVMDAAPTRYISTPTAASGILSGLQVLIVEDEDPLRRLLARVVKREKCSVATAGTAAEALEHIEKQGSPPDLLITDIVMPGMNGKALASHLRKQYPDLSILFMTGYPEDMTGDQPAFGDEIQLLIKPFTEDELLVKMQEAIKKPQTPSLIGAGRGET